MKKDLIKKVINRFFEFKKSIIIIVIITIISALIGIVNPLLIGRIIDDAILKSDYNLLISLVVSLVILIIIGQLLTALRRYITSNIVLNFIRKLRFDVFESILYTSSNFFHVNSKGDILQRIIDDTKSVQDFSLQTFPTFFYNLILAIFSITVVFTIYWPLGIVGIFVYIIYLIPVKHFGNRQRIAASKLTMNEAEIKQNLLWKLQSIKLIKIFGTEEREYKEFLNLQNRWGKLTHKKYEEENKFMNFPRVLDALAPGLVYGIGGWQVFKGILSIGDLIAITRLLPAINAPIRSFSSTFLAIKSIGVRLERVYEYLDSPIEPGKRSTLKEVSSIDGKIEFKDVYLTINNNKILDGVSFTINAGEHIAFVGISGSGKSSILNLITRLLEPTKGEIFIDNIPLRELDTSALRKRIGIVSQAPFLFNDSIINNLTFLQETSLSEIKNITNAIGADHFIENLPKGYDTILLENGSSLSGGQKQRLSIARELIGKPDILLLDEATSALDSDSEYIVQSSILNLMKGRTALFVAHRLESIIEMDRILVIQDGKVIEEGNHTTLLSQSGHYSDLWKAKSLK